jgi:ATP-dependent RNA helicase SrmB
MLPELTEQTTSFSGLGLAEPLLAAIKKLGYEKPTPVQEQAIPPALGHHDLLVSAETGSGKTAAFLLPSLQQLLNIPSSQQGTRVLILTPTRELAQQILLNCQQLSQFTDIKSGLVTGGDDFKRQQNLFRKQTEIIVATPGRLQEQLLSDTPPDLSQLDILILDEADRMLDMGFKDDVLAIAKHCNATRQTLLFSATLTHFGVIKIADQILKNHPKTVALNTLHDGHSNIEQQIILADDNEHKQKLLVWLLHNDTYDKALIFTNSRLQAIALHNFLLTQKCRVGVLHGEMDQKDRNRIMSLYRGGTINIMAATDLAARGLDIQGINLVINFDVPRNGINYIHRIGRSGRVEEQGVAISLVKHTEWNLMASIERFLKQNFTRRNIETLIGSYKGPKKVKASGKAVGSKSDVVPKKAEVKKVKVRARDKKNIGKRRVPTSKIAE